MKDPKINHDDSMFNNEIIPQRIHRLSLPHGVKFCVPHAGEGDPTPMPLITVFRGKLDDDESFVVSLCEEPAVLTGNVFLSSGELAEVLEHFNKYRSAYLYLHQNSGSDVDELALRMNEIDGL